MKIEELMEKRGYWWLPEYPDKKIPGTLVIESNGRCCLKLMGKFDGHDVKEISKYSIILGRLQNSKDVTLIDSYVESSSFWGNGYAYTELYSKHTVIGYGFCSIDDVAFTGVDFELEHLGSWLLKSGIKIEHSDDLKVSTVKFNLLEKEKYTICPGLLFGFKFFSSLPMTYYYHESVELSQKPVVSIESNEEIFSINELLRYVWKFSNFFCFVSNHRLPLKIIHAFNSEIVDERSNPIYMDIYSQSFMDHDSISPFYGRDVLLNYEDIKDRFPEIVNRWRILYDKILPSLNLYFSVMHGKNILIEQRFSSMVNALESLHRRLYCNSVFSKSEYETKVHEVLDSVPKEHREWIEGRLKYGNEPNLRFRLKKLIKPFSFLLGNSEKRSRITTKIVNNRNYLTHYDESLTKQAASITSMSYLCDFMEILFQLNLLLLLECSIEESADSVKNNWKLSAKLERAIHYI